VSGLAAVVWVFFITPDANGIHGEPEITWFPNFDREITLEKPLTKSFLSAAVCDRRNSPEK
jgi:hypothetical protein